MAEPMSPARQTPAKTPPRKNPLQKTETPLLPPGARSRAAHLLIPVAGRGEFRLQSCAGCGRFLWPMHEACPDCLSPDLPLTPAPRGGEVISATTAEVPADSYFRAHAPWRVGLVQLDCGPQALAHLHPQAGPGSRVRLSLVLDRAGQAVLHASPEQERDMTTDPQWQEMAGGVAGRRVLITDARHIAALPLAQALLKAGAAKVWLGLPESWKPYDAALESLPGAELLPLDLQSDRSVQDLATDIGAKLEILINTADLPRPGPALAPAAAAHARAMMEVTAFGLMRLMQAFAPVMAMRGADGLAPARTWVNLLPVFARVPHPGFAGYAAAHAAALALTPSLRAILGQGGVRLLTAFTGPTDTDWFDAFPHPKLTGPAIAKGLVDALQMGLEELVIGDLARDWLDRQAQNPRALEAELARGQL